MKTETCLSTHGGSGYAPGSYLEDDCVICGMCGYRIENPPSTGARTVLLQGQCKWLYNWFGIGKTEEIPNWMGMEKARKE